MAATIAVVLLGAIVAAYWLARKRAPSAGRVAPTAAAPASVPETGTGAPSWTGAGASAAPPSAPPGVRAPPGPPRAAPGAPAEMPGAPVDPAEQAIASLRRAARFGFAPLKDGQDNFSVILGIDSATADLLRANSINSFAMLAATPARTLGRLLVEGGSAATPRGHDHWPLQARLCVRGEWEELKALQQQLRTP